MVFKVQPSEFWGMTVGEWWVLYDMHREQMEAIGDRGGARRLTGSDVEELKRGLDEELRKERAEHGQHGQHPGAS